MPCRHLFSRSDWTGVPSLSRLVPDFHRHGQPVRLSHILYIPVLTDHPAGSVLYAAPNTYRTYIKSFADEYPIWISNYYYKPYFDWTFWQYTDDGELQGYDGYQTHIDLNVYAGSMDEFRKQFGLQEF